MLRWRGWEAYVVEQVHDRWAAGPGLAASLWRFRWAIAAVTLAVGVAAYFGSLQQPPRYTATAEVLLRDPRDPGLLGGDAGRFHDPERYFPQQAEKMESPAVLEAAASSLGSSASAEEVADSVSAAADVELNLITVTAERPRASEAAAFANAVAGAYEAVVAQDVQQEAERAVGAIEEQLADLREQAEQAEADALADPEDTVAASRARILIERIIAMESAAADIAAQAAVEGSGVEGTRQASVPERPSSPKPERNAAVAAFLAFAVASAGAYWFSLRDSRIQSAAEPAEILGAPLLGEVPKYRVANNGTVAGRLTVPPGVTEAFEFVLSSIEYALADVTSGAVVVTSASAGDGKTVSALQLALAARRDNRDVTLIDADLRAQGLTTLLAANESPGLANLIRGQMSRTEATKRYRIEDDVILPVVTAGEWTEDAANLLRRDGLGRAFQALKDDAGLLILDTPPLLAVVDASIVASHADGVVLVVSPETSVEHLRRIKERLAFVDTPVLGYVFNRAETDFGPYDYYGDNKTRSGRFGRGRHRPAPRPSSRSTPEPVRRREPVKKSMSPLKG